jgi:hypothetical protein
LGGGAAKGAAGPEALIAGCLETGLDVSGLFGGGAANWPAGFAGGGFTIAGIDIASGFGGGAN